MGPIGFPELVIILVFSLALFAALIYGLVRFVSWAARGKTVPCPRCAEHVKPHAKVCRFCGLVIDQ